jgi:hypothetical protein
LEQAQVLNPATKELREIAEALERGYGFHDGLEVEEIERIAQGVKKLPDSLFVHGGGKALRFSFHLPESGGAEFFA